MRAGLWILLLWASSGWLQAQNITKVEYFIDTDPGFGKGTNVPISAGTDLNNVSFALNVNSLSTGFHTLNVRARDATGKWSLTNSRSFYKEEVPASLPNVTRVEYFVNTDPGFGKATNIPVTASTDLTNVTTSIAVTSLPTGFHSLHVRARDATGKWSLTNSRSFYKEEVPASLPNVTRVEYFFDTDPGFGKATTIPVTAGTNLTNVTTTIPLTSLATGFHSLHVRARDATGKWSLTNVRALYKEDLPAAVPNVTRVEYFIDDDPGFGKGTNVPVTAGTNLSNVAFTVNLTNVPTGFHKLQVRARDATGKWSLTNVRAFYKEDLPASLPNIVRAEYFIDDDPGFGKGRAVTVTPGTDLTNLSFTADLQGLALGGHTLYVRAQDASGKWSLTNLKAFSVDNVTGLADLRTVGVEVNLFPNPSNGSFQLTIDAPKEELYTVEVFDVLGRVVYLKDMRNSAGKHAEEIRLDSESGVYTLQLTSLRGIHRQRLIVRQ
jgi:hypothetical protein